MESKSLINSYYKAVWNSENEKDMLKILNNIFHSEISFKFDRIPEENENHDNFLIMGKCNVLNFFKHLYSIADFKSTLEKSFSSLCNQEKAETFYMIIQTQNGKDYQIEATETFTFDIED